MKPWVFPHVTGHRYGTDRGRRYRFHICLAYFVGLCKGISPQNMALYGPWYSTSILGSWNSNWVNRHSTFLDDQEIPRVSDLRLSRIHRDEFFCISIDTTSKDYICCTLYTLRSPWVHKQVKKQNLQNALSFCDMDACLLQINQTSSARARCFEDQTLYSNSTWSHNKTRLRTRRACVEIAAPWFFPTIVFPVSLN